MPIKLKVGALIIDEGNILLIQEKSDSETAPLWNFIKGTYEEDKDDSIFDTAIRECEEEAGVKVELTGALGFYFAKTGDKTRVQFNFFAKIVDGTAKIPDADEQNKRNEYISDVRWFSKEEISAMQPEDFISNRTYQALRDYLHGKHHPLEIIKTVTM